MVSHFGKVGQKLCVGCTAAKVPNFKVNNGNNVWHINTSLLSYLSDVHLKIWLSLEFYQGIIIPYNWYEGICFLMSSRGKDNMDKLQSILTKYFLSIFYSFWQNCRPQHEDAKKQEPC